MRSRSCSRARARARARSRSTLRPVVCLTARADLADCAGLRVAGARALFRGYHPLTGGVDLEPSFGRSRKGWGQGSGEGVGVGVGLGLGSVRVRGAASTCSSRR